MEIVINYFLFIYVGIRGIWNDERLRDAGLIWLVDLAGSDYLPDFRDRLLLERNPKAKGEAQVIVFGY